MLHTDVDGELAPRTYGELVDALEAYADHPAVHLTTIDAYCRDPSLVSGQGSAIECVDLTYSQEPDATIVITAGRHSSEYAGPEAAVALIERILASPGMQAYLAHGEVTIVPAVHTDEYAKPPEERTPMFRLKGHMLPSPNTYRYFDACRNSGHEGYLAGDGAPDYTGDISFFDQLYAPDDDAFDGFADRDPLLISREAYATARLLDAKAAERNVLMAADLHETDHRTFSYATLVFNEELSEVVADVNAHVAKHYPVQEAKVQTGADTFSGFCCERGIDAYTIEGAVMDGDRRMSLAERVEQQLLALDALLEHYAGA